MNLAATYATLKLRVSTGAGTAFKRYPQVVKCMVTGSGQHHTDYKHFKCVDYFLKKMLIQSFPFSFDPGVKMGNNSIYLGAVPVDFYMSKSRGVQPSHV